MGFRVGDTRALGLSPKQRIHIFGLCTDLDAISWMVATIRAHLASTDANTPEETVSTSMRGGYTSFHPLPTLSDMPLFPMRADTEPPLPRGPPPRTHPWTLKFIPENWVYTDGSDIKDQPWLRAAVIHTPTCTIIYINAARTEETRAIMQAELVAIHTALTMYASHVE